MDFGTERESEKAEVFYGFGKVLTTMESWDQRGGASEDSVAEATDLSTPFTAIPRVRVW